MQWFLSKWRVFGRALVHKRLPLLDLLRILIKEKKSLLADVKLSVNIRPERQKIKVFFIHLNAKKQY